LSSVVLALKTAKYRDFDLIWKSGDCRNPHPFHRSG